MGSIRDYQDSAKELFENVHLSQAQSRHKDLGIDELWGMVRPWGDSKDLELTG